MTLSVIEVTWPLIEKELHLLVKLVFSSISLRTKDAQNGKDILKFSIIQRMYLSIDIKAFIQHTLIIQILTIFDRAFIIITIIFKYKLLVVKAYTTTVTIWSVF